MVLDFLPSTLKYILSTLSLQTIHPSLLCNIEERGAKVGQILLDLPLEQVHACSLTTLLYSLFVIQPSMNWSCLQYHTQSNTMLIQSTNEPFSKFEVEVETIQLTPMSPPTSSLVLTYDQLSRSLSLKIQFLQKINYFYLSLILLYQNSDNWQNNMLITYSPKNYFYHSVQKVREIERNGVFSFQRCASRESWKLQL